MSNQLKEKLKNKLEKSGGKPCNENYNASGQRYGSITVTQKGKQHYLVWELVDRSGRTVDFLKKDYPSFDDMWLELSEFL